MYAKMTAMINRKGLEVHTMYVRPGRGAGWVKLTMQRLSVCMCLRHPRVVMHGPTKSVGVIGRKLLAASKVEYPMYS
jgi:hypothetical protein